MANTLTSQLTAGQTYTTMAVTAFTVAALSGEIVFASISLVNVEAFVLSAPVSVGDTTLHVVSQQAAFTHLVGETVAPKHTLVAVGRTLSPIVTLRTHKI